MKKTILYLVLVAMLATILSACGGEKLECTDELGCVEIAEGDPIMLASSLVISGPNTQLGLDSQWGVEIAIKYANEDGGVLGHTIELQAEDDGCNAEGGQASAQKVVSNPDIVALIGTSCSGAGVPASEIISEAGYVMVSPSNTAPVLTDSATHGAGYLRTAHNDKVQGRAMAEFAYNELGLRTAAAIHDGDPYTEGLASVFRAAFEELGGEVVAFEAVTPDATDLTPVLTTIAAAGPPEFLYYPVFIELGANITKQSQEVDGLNNVVLAAADGVQSPDFIAAAGDAAEGMYASGPDLGFGNDLYKKFLATYKEDYGTEPTAPFHAHAYDATSIILAAIEKVAVQGDDGSLMIGRQALREALFATSNFAGVTGTLTCDANGDCADPQITVNEVQNGEFVPIWP